MTSFQTWQKSCSGNLLLTEMHESGVL